MANLQDALKYMDAVRSRFRDTPEVYDAFSTTLKEFKSHTIDAPEVLERVSTIFCDHADLVEGFNVFAPAGYRIDCETEGVFTITTPFGFTTQRHSLKSDVKSDDDVMPNSIVDEEDDDADGWDEFDHAIQFLDEVKSKFDDNFETYKKFIEILRSESDSCKREQSHGEDKYARAYSRLQILFRDEPDLLAGFEYFSPKYED